MLRVLGELSYLLLQSGVLGDDPLKWPFREIVLVVADLAKEFCDVGALGADLALVLGKCLFGVKGSFSPGWLSAAAAVGGRAGMGSA